MLRPEIILSPATSLEVMRSLILRDADPGPLTYKPRYQRDAKRTRPFSGRDVWQPPELTDRLRVGDCDDWLRRLAAHEARRQPLWLCISRVGPRDWHYYARREDGSIWDLCPAGGMPPVTYGVEESRVRIAPEDFMRMDEADQGGGPRKVTYDQFSSELKISNAVVGAAAAIIGASFPAALPIVAPIAAGYTTVTAAIDATVKARLDAQKKNKKAPSRQKIQKLFAAESAEKIATAATKRGQSVESSEVKKAQEMAALVVAAQTSPKAQIVLGKMLARKPVEKVVDENGKEKVEVDQQAIYARLATGIQMLTGKTPGNLDLDKLFGESEVDEAGGPCCAACARDAFGLGAGEDEEDDEEEGGGAGDEEFAFVDELAGGEEDDHAFVDELAAGNEGGGFEGQYFESDDGAGGCIGPGQYDTGAGWADEIADRWVERIEQGAGCARGCPVR